MYQDHSSKTRSASWLYAYSLLFFFYKFLFFKWKIIIKYYEVTKKKKVRLLKNTMKANRTLQEKLSQTRRFAPGFDTDGTRWEKCRRQRKTPQAKINRTTRDMKLRHCCFLLCTNHLQTPFAINKHKQFICFYLKLIMNDYRLTLKGK